MNLDDLILLEELKVKSGDKAIDKLFRQKLEQVFSPMFLKKIDRLFNVTLRLKEFKQNSNVMCYTSGVKIYVNKTMFKSIPAEKAMNYIMHELFHVLSNTGKFSEFNMLNKRLLNIVINGVPRGMESDFFTGKHQNIHSDWKEEVINYLCNDSINWDVGAPGIKMAYKTAIAESGIFKMSSPFWKKRFGDTETYKKVYPKKIKL